MFREIGTRPVPDQADGPSRDPFGHFRFTGSESRMPTWAARVSVLGRDAEYRPPVCLWRLLSDPELDGQRCSVVN